MDSILIQGGKRLEGTIPISGAKNSALTLLPCALLTEEKLTLTNLPRLADVDSFGHLLNELGVSTKVDKHKDEIGRRMTLHADTLDSTTAPYDMVRRMRASILVLGPLLARMGDATVSLPGGCAIGDRPIDLHLKALEAMGAEIELAAGYVRVRAPRGGRIAGGDFTFPVVSVGATENAVMAAVTARGRTNLYNAAREPEIVDLCRLLQKMGAQIEGAGSPHISIEGVEGLNGCTYAVMPDRIEAGSYACAAGITGGSIDLVGARPEDMLATTHALAQCGLIVEFHDKGLRVSADHGLKPLALSTAPFPGFATDMQAQFMAMLCRAGGESFLEETIFENRYMHVPELRRMGANIDVRGRSAIVHGVERMTGAKVMATDLRASMSLILAGLAAEGETEVLRVYHLDRGYERLEDKLSAVGATIERKSGG
jgi:UDP-N-acetylglucosamine 1-carboxyvinyltransferase